MAFVGLHNAFQAMLHSIDGSSLNSAQLLPRSSYTASRGATSVRLTPASVKCLVLGDRQCHLIPTRFSDCCVTTYALPPEYDSSSLDLPLACVASFDRERSGPGFISLYECSTNAIESIRPHVLIFMLCPPLGH